MFIKVLSDTSQCRLCGTFVFNQSETEFYNNVTGVPRDGDE